ncbi:MAG: hypothetical protein KA291_06185 [Psychrobacter sp.]|nr:hypothetical protein [Psychrobacter sp.]
MEPLSFASFSLAAILASLPANGEAVSKPTITTHISPAIAGQWEIDLNSSIRMTKEAEARQAALKDKSPLKSNEPKIDAGAGLLTQNEKRFINIQPDTSKKLIASSKKSAQCRELYNFAADNEMWSVSGKEWTYGRYLITHREEGLPIIAIKTVYDNNEVDCSGSQIDQSNEALIAFLNHDGNQMQWCADPDGTECFMNFNRILP